MIGIRTVIYKFDAAVLSQPASQGLVLLGLTLETQGQSLDASHGQVTLEGSERRAGYPRQGSNGFVMSFVRDDKSPENVTMTGQVLGRAVNHDIGAERKRPNQHRGCERTVYN